MNKLNVKIRIAFVILAIIGAASSIFVGFYALKDYNFIKTLECSVFSILFIALGFVMIDTIEDSDRNP